MVAARARHADPPQPALTREPQRPPPSPHPHQGQESLKYKLAESGRGRSDDYYQLLAYLTALALPRGVLIYCQTSGDAPSRRVEVVHTGKHLLTYPVDLTGSRPKLEAAIDDLASWIVAEAC